MEVAIRHVVLKIASRCNLNCSYCYLYNHGDVDVLSHPKMLSSSVLNDLVDVMVRHADLTGGRIGVTLHGGEPTLVGTQRFEQIVTRLREGLGDRLESLTLQTNATLINRDWASLLARLEIAVGVSLDGVPELHDRFRITHSGKGSYAATVRGLNLLREFGIEPRVLSVVSPGADGAATYRHFRQLGLRFVDFLLPDVSHDNKSRIYGDDGDVPVFAFLDGALKAWLAENDSSVRIPIFWDLLEAKLAGASPRSECFGSRALSYVVVNTDGSIEPLDALKVCGEGMTRTSANVSHTELADLASEDGLLGTMLRGEIEPCAQCRRCEYLRLCGGGYLPHRYSEAAGFDNPSVWCEDIKRLLARLGDIIEADDCLSART